MQKGQVKIIGGQWRGKKLTFPALSGLRPTPNRVRETLFNWLAPRIHHTNCLDLFAGSGILGFEALSRGAKSVSFVEQSPLLISYLNQQINALAIREQACVYRRMFPFNSKTIVNSEPAKFDIIFADPPFNKNLIPQVCDWLIKENLISAQSLLYLEMEATIKKIQLAENWQIMHWKTAGQVTYTLINVTA